MSTLQSVAPCPALRELVRAFAQRTTGAAETAVMQRVPASLEVVIGFEFGSLFTVDYRDGSSEPAHRIALVGSHCSPNATLSLGADVESFAIFLQPTALQRLLGIPTHHVADRSYPAADVLGRQVEVLWAVLAEAAGFAERVRLAEQFLLWRLDVASPTTIAHVAMETFRGHGRYRVEEMAGRASLSVRQFERQFERELGMPPKRFARIARFQFALDTKLVHPRRSWLDVAHTSGYYDQMHLVRDFQSLSGASPTQLLSQLGDTRPPALANAETAPG
jgi:AraC-like DNA-binding protein